jgi:hypothetical protein
MKTIKSITLLILFANLFIFTSCEKDDETPVNTHDDAKGDVILKKMNMMGNIKYLPVFFADGADIAETGSTVQGPDGTSYDLHDIPWMNGNKQTGGGSPSATKPMAGTYTFKLKFTDGYEKTVTDELETTEIDVPMITAFNYDELNQTIHLEWTPVANPDLYCVKITELDMANTKPLFKKAQLPTNSNTLDINFDGSNGWMRPVSDFQTGTDYYIVIAAKKVEAGTTVSGASTDFQTSACNKRTFTY